MATPSSPKSTSGRENYEVNDDLTIYKLMDLFVLLVISSFSFFLLNPVAGRGGERQSELPDHRERLHGRHLFEDKPYQIPVFPQQEDAFNGYMTNSELQDFVKDFGQRCANISTIYSIGRSVKGFPLWVIEISDKPGEEEPEPAFKFIANMHGDEPVGREMLVRLANWLCENYTKDPLATLIIKHVHLHILPTMNPDGFSLRKRGNANNVDLNRDFPDQFFHMNDVLDLRQPETKAVMSWIKEGHFTASASLHGGALVVNYPWDGSQDSRKQYYGCPDDKTFRYLAQVYSKSHRNMSLSTEFPGGITNGAYWYPVYGGMQDWNYIHGGCFELTIELSDVKWPKASELSALWEDNRLSMLNLVATLVKTGVHGRIFSSTSGRPLPASVMINGIYHKVNGSTKSGSYHRLLVPGESYEVVASMPGYQSKATRILLGDEAAHLDFLLDPLEEEKPTITSSSVACNCRYRYDNVDLVDYLKGAHVEIYLAIVVVLLFVYLLFRKKLTLRSLNHRQTVGHMKITVV